MRGGKKGLVVHSSGGLVTELYGILNLNPGCGRGRRRVFCGFGIRDLMGDDGCPPLAEMGGSNMPEVWKQSLGETAPLPLVTSLPSGDWLEQPHAIALSGRRYLWRYLSPCFHPALDPWTNWELLRADPSLHISFFVPGM